MPKRIKTHPKKAAKKIKSVKTNPTTSWVYAIIAILVIILFIGVVFNTFVLAGNSGTGFDAGKWGKKATDQQTTRSMTPTPTPALAKTQDTVPPTVHINYPPDGFSYSTASIGIRASASDNTGISHVNFYVNGVLKYVSTVPVDVPDVITTPAFAYNVPGPEYLYSWTPPTSNTTYTIEVAAYDLAHNVTTAKIQMNTYPLSTS